MLTLELTEDGKTQTLQFPQDQITIGRSRENVIVVKNRKASRLHAKIECIDGTYQITDQGSGNGTKVNGEKVNFQLLSANDEIKIGDAVLVLKSIDEAAEAPPVSEDSEISLEDAETPVPGSDGLTFKDEERETEIEVKAVAPPPPKAAPAPKAASAPAPKPPPAPPPKAPPAAPPAKGKPVIAPRPRPSLADRFKKKKD